MNRVGIIESSWIIHGWGQGAPIQADGTPISPIADHEHQSSGVSASQSVSDLSPVDGTPVGLFALLPFSSV